MGEAVHVVDAPHVSIQSVGGALQRPREQRQLPPEAALVEASGVRGEQAQVLSERTQSMVAAAVDHMTEWRLNCRHVLRQEVVLHLQDTHEKTCSTLYRARVFMIQLFQYCLQHSYLHDASVVEACYGGLVQVAVVDGSLQRLCRSAVISSSAEDPLRRQTSGLDTHTEVT